MLPRPAICTISLSTNPGDVPALAEEAIFNSAKASEILGDFDHRLKKNYEPPGKKDYPKSQHGTAADKALTRLSGEQDDLNELKKLAELPKKSDRVRPETAAFRTVWFPGLIRSACYGCDLYSSQLTPEDRIVEHVAKCRTDMLCVDAYLAGRFHRF